MAKNKADRELLSKLLRTKLTEPCPINQIPMGMQGAGLLVAGAKVPTYGDVVVFVLLEQASAGKEWAVEQVLDRTEGKPVQAVRQEDADRSTEEMLTDVSVKHLNLLAEKFKKRHAVNEPSKQPKLDTDPGTPPAHAEPPAPNPNAPNVPAGPASRLLSLPKNGPPHPQNP